MFDFGVEVANTETTKSGEITFQHSVPIIHTIEIVSEFTYVTVKL